MKILGLSSYYFIFSKILGAIDLVSEYLQYEKADLCLAIGSAVSRRRPERPGPRAPRNGGPRAAKIYFLIL